MILPKKVFKTILIIIISCFLTIVFFGDEKIKNFLLSGQLKRKIEELDKDSAKIFKKVLGRATAGIGKVEKTDIFLQTKQKVENAVDESTSRVKNLPQDQLKKLKREIKEQICQEWLKEEE